MTKRNKAEDVTMPKSMKGEVKGKLQDGLNALEEKLEQDGEEFIFQTVQGAIEDQPSESIERNLVENLSTYLDHEGIVNVILNILTNNNPYFYEEMDLDVPPNSKSVLEKLARKFGLRIKRSIKRYYGPNDWRYLNSEARQGEKFQGTRLHTNILKWNDERVVLTSSIPDVIRFANHFIKNLNSKFDQFSDDDAELMLKRLQQMKENIEVLESKVSEAHTS